MLLTSKNSALSYISITLLVSCAGVFLFYYILSSECFDTGKLII